MASVDGSKSLPTGSDEMFDNICGPCKQDNVENGANHYCVECGEYLCGQCKDYHRKLPVTKNHKIISDGKMPTADTANEGSSLVIYCGCNKNQTVEVYCENHEDVICSPCKIIKHHKCQTIRIQEKCTNYTTARLNSVLSRTKYIKEKFIQLKQEHTKAIKDLKLSKDTCKEEIKTFRKELEKYLDELEQDLLNDLDKRENKYQTQLDHQISTLTSVMQMLDTDYKLLENARRDGRKTTMLTSDVHVSKSLKDYEERLAELEKDARKPRLSFERNEKLDEMQSQIKNIGYLKETLRDKQMLLGRKILVQSCSKVNVRSANDQRCPWISAFTFMPSGHMALCDRNNSNIKLLNTASVDLLQETLTLPDIPWDLSLIDANNVIVSLPNKMQLHYIQVLPQMKAGRVIQLDKESWGIEVSGDKIYTTCHNDPDNGEVRILSLDGKMIQRLGVKQDGSFMFTSPFYITICQSGRKIYVSDTESSTVTCMSVDGNIIYEYKEAKLNPVGLYVDAGDNVFVCDWDSHNVHVITAEGRKYETLLSSSDGLKNPYSVTYMEKDDRIVVGFRNQDKMCLFKLAK